MRHDVSHSETPRWTLKSVGRACEVLAAFSDRGQWTLAELTRELNEHKSAVHRTVMTLVEAGFLWRDPHGTYYLGGEFLRVAATAAVPSLVAVGRPILEELAAITQETASLSNISGRKGIYLDIVNSPQSMRFTLDVGQTFGLNAGASGRILLAYQSEQFISDLLADEVFDRYTERTIMRREQIIQELAQIKAAEYYATDGEITPEARSIGAPILDASGRLQGCLAISGPVYRLPDAEVPRTGRIVRAHADKFSLAFG